jgi:hypothetical protein
LEPTIPDLQAQIDRLSLSLHHSRESNGQVEPVSQRLVQLTERCADILNRWAEADVRHRQAIGQIEGRLGEWNAVEGKLHQDAAERLRDLEASITREWSALREMHTEPVRELREQAARLGELCVSAANVALQGFERAEARLSAIESNIQQQLGQMSQDLRLTLAEIRRDNPPALGTGVAPFSLEGVRRIHEELRGGQTPQSDALTITPVAVDGGGSGAVSTALAPVAAGAGFSDGSALTARMESLEREVAHEREEAHETAEQAHRLRRDWRLALAIGLAAVVGLGAIGWRLQQTMSARLDEAAARVAAAETASAAASEQAAAIQANAARQLADASAAAARAATMTSVLAAPDLVRYSLLGLDAASGSFAQVLFSRSRGLVVSASALPAPAAGQTYHLWMWSGGVATSGGAFTPDAAGRATVTIDNPTYIPRPLTGVTVTSENGPSQTLPVGPLVLARGVR